MENFKQLFGELLLQYLKDAKKEIEADGLIPTLDEAIERVEKWKTI